jgi:hypothetical protein
MNLAKNCIDGIHVPINSVKNHYHDFFLHKEWLEFNNDDNTFKIMIRRTMMRILMMIIIIMIIIRIIINNRREDQ